MFYLRPELGKENKKFRCRRPLLPRYTKSIINANLTYLIRYVDLSRYVEYRWSTQPFSGEYLRRLCGLVFIFSSCPVTCKSLLFGTKLIRNTTERPNICFICITAVFIQ